MKYLVFWCLALSLADFILMGVDKRRARRGVWRVPEKCFLCWRSWAELRGPSWGCGHFGTRPDTGTFGMGCLRSWSFRLRLSG